MEKRSNTKAKRIILELLHEPSGKLTKYRIAKETETNISWVLAFLKKLEKKKLVKGTMVLNVNKLIDYYLELDKPPKRLLFMVKQPVEYVKEAKWDYIITTYIAENMVCHHLFPSWVDVYVKKTDLEKWKKQLFKKGLVGGGNLRLRLPNDEYIFKFKRKINGINIVSIPLLLIDLKREGGVCIQSYEWLVKKYVQRRRN